MKNLAFIPIAALLILISCTSGVKNSESSEAAEETASNPAPAMTPAHPKPQAHFSASHNGPGYTFQVEADNGEMTQVHVYTEGMEHDYNETIGIEGQVLESHMLDLNGDGSKEFYLTVLPTDDSGNIDIMGFASLGGKSMVQVFVQDPEELRTMHTDKVTVQGGKLVRTFESGGQKMTYSYKLVAGENGYSLQAEKVSG